MPSCRRVESALASQDAQAGLKAVLDGCQASITQLVTVMRKQQLPPLQHALVVSLITARLGNRGVVAQLLQ